MTLNEKVIELAKKDKDHDVVRGWREVSQALGLSYPDNELGDQVMFTYNTERLRDRKMIGETK